MDRFLVGLAVLLAFGVGLAGGLSGRSHDRTRTFTTTTVEVVNGLRSAGATPAPIPTRVEAGSDARAVPLSLGVPADAQVVGAAIVKQSPAQVIVSWERAHLTPNGTATWQRYGVAIWQYVRGAAAWRRAFLRELPTTKLTNIHGYRISLGDVSGDMRPEVLIFEDRDGSAGNGTYRLFANAGADVRRAFVKPLSQDQGTVAFGPHRLVVREGVGYYDRGPHCCFRRVRETWLRWDGRRAQVVHRAMHQNRRGWPPG